MKKILALLIFALTLFTCNKEDDPCSGITCENGGVCINGACDCPERYTGPDCSDQVTPVRIIIKNITVENFPPTEPNGAGWDLLDGADIYIQVYKGNAEIYTSPTFYEDANPNLRYTFVPSNFLSFDAPKDRYSILLYDYDDFDADDFMGGIEFTPYDNQNGFPATLSVELGQIKFEMEVEYQF